MNMERSGRLVEYIGYIVLLVALFRMSTLFGLLGLGAVLAVVGIRWQHWGERHASSEEVELEEEAGAELGG